MTTTRDAQLYDVHSRIVNAGRPEELLEAAYMQLHSYRLSPEHYVLPNTYKWMLPLIENYGEDPEGFLEFARSVVDHFPKRSDTRIPVQLVYRRVNSWVDQIIRRERVGHGLDTHRKVHGEFPDKPTEHAYAKNLFSWWMLRRKNMLGLLTRNSPDGKSTAQDRADACTRYWQEVHDDLLAGKVPRYDEINRLLEEAAAAHELIFGKKP